MEWSELGSHQVNSDLVWQNTFCLLYVEEDGSFVLCLGCCGSVAMVIQAIVLLDSTQLGIPI
jgi:hypothetical protein